MTVNRIATTFSVTDNAIIEGIRHGLSNDATARAVRNDPDGHPRFEDKDRILYFEGLLYVPTSQRQVVL